MPSFQDSAFLIFLALLLFGPKGLAKLAREAGKLMGEFRRASNDFRMQMEDEFRQDEQAEQQKKIAAMQAAAPVTPAFDAASIPEPEHPHTPAGELAVEPAALPAPDATAAPEAVPEHHIDGRADGAGSVAPLPIAENGELAMMPPATGLPQGRGPSSTSLSGVFDSIPQAAETHPPAAEAVHAETANG